jgi:hypothetical protein
MRKEKHIFYVGKEEKTVLLFITRITGQEAINDFCLDDELYKYGGIIVDAVINGFPSGREFFNREHIDCREVAFSFLKKFNRRVRGEHFEMMFG